MYSNNGISTLHSSVQLRCRLHYCVEKLFRTPPHFGMTPPKSGRVLAKCGGVLKKIDRPTFKSVATPLVRLEPINSPIEVATEFVLKCEFCNYI